MNLLLFASLLFPHFAAQSEDAKITSLTATIYVVTEEKALATDKGPVKEHFSQGAVAVIEVLPGSSTLKLK